MNHMVHREPLIFFVDGIYWFCVLFVGCPIVGIIQLFRTIWNLIVSLFTKPIIMEEFLPINVKKNNNNSNNNKEMAIVITGCDTGFGKELVFELVNKQYSGLSVIFAGCLQEESFGQFPTTVSPATTSSTTRIVPILMDVTNEGQILEAATVVNDWIQNEDHKNRHLHAIVNNAGIGVPGLVDWVELSDFRKCMDINYHGIIRVVKSFYPILKRQAAASPPPSSLYSSSSRIINITSIAGLYSPMPCGVAYGASKFAAEALTTNLKQEMKLFNVKVIGINPSFHKTPLFDLMIQNMMNMWNKLPQDKQHFYGKEYIDRILSLPQAPAWDSSHVTDEIIKSITYQNPSSDSVLVGMDAKLLLHLLTKIPINVKLFLTGLNKNLLPTSTPAIMKKKKRNK